MIKRLVRRAIDNFKRWDYDASNTIDACPRAIWLFSRATGPVAATALAVGIGLAAPAGAHISARPSALSAYTPTPRRIGASMGVVVALIGAVIGGRALARAAGRNGAVSGRFEAIKALVLGPVGLVIGGLVVATAKGGLGTGNGLGGGVIAIMLGLVGTALGWLALTRSRPTG